MVVQKTIKLNSGYEMPTVGLGTWTMFKNPEGEMARVIAAAIKAGYRHIDTAKVYGTEPLMGPVIAKLIESGEIKREDIFITCKVWCTDHHPDNMHTALAQSLKDLQTDYIDMLLIHWPMAYKHGDVLFPKDDKDEVIYADDDYVDTWKAMEECVDKGQVRSIGLSNFNIQQTERVLSIARIQPSNMQVELNAYHSNSELVEFCKSKGMAVSAYAPIGSPGRIWYNEGEPHLLEEAIVKELATKYNKSGAQVLLRHTLQKGLVVLPKSVTESRIIENIGLYDFSLSSEDAEKLDGLNQNLRVYAEPMAAKSPYYPF